MSSARTAHLDQLTGARGLAAWFVVLYHIRLSLVSILPEQVIGVFAYGYLAVDIFFLLSGFVMWISYGERFRDTGGAIIAPFLWKRFARIWPLHALVLAGFMMLVLVLAVSGRSIDAYPLAELPLHIVLMQNWGFTDALSWNPPAWSISTEFAAYLAFPAIVLAIKWERLSKTMLVAVLFGLTLALHGWFAQFGATSLGDEIPKTGLVRCLIEFTMGIALAQLWRHMRSDRHGAILALGVSVALATTGLAAGLAQTLWVPLCCSALLLALALDTGLAARWLGSYRLVQLGDWSYATYLSHYLLFIAFKLAFVGEDLQTGWAGLIGYMAMVLVCSALLYSRFEKPVQSWLNRHPPLLFRAA